MPTRREDKIFDNKTVEIAEIVNQQSSYWQRKNNSASLKLRSTLHASHRLTPERVDFREDPLTVVEDLGSFDTKVSAGRGASFKYPNVELTRCYDAKKFR